MFSLHVLLFSVLRQRVGEGKLTLRMTEGVTGAALLDDLADRFPAIRDYRGVIRLAVNQEYVPETVVLADGDEVALITPVSGG